jgi:hypothetical protein
MDQKGEWQELTDEVHYAESDIRVFLYFNKLNVIDFSTLKGYVIYAYPQISLFNSSDSIAFMIPKTKGNIINNIKNKLCSIDFQNKKNEDEIARKGYISKFKIILNYDSLTENRIAAKSYTTLNLGSIVNFISLFHIGDWTSRSFTRDTSYNKYKSEIVVDSINSYIDKRKVRWQFALKIFSREYNWRQKIFGGGFNFLNWYGYYFYGDKTRCDYPHNPFLHVLLYSGIIGLLLYIFLMYKVFYYYIKYIKEYYLIFIFFLTTFFFAFFSGGNPFDPPIMGFFVILPFFIHYVHEKDKSFVKEKDP